MMSLRLTLVAIISMMVPLPFAEQTTPAWIRSEEGQVLNAPHVQEAVGKLGVRLVAVHTHHFASDALVHLRHPVAEPPEMPEGRRLQYTGTNQRDLIRLCAKLNLAGYTSTLDASEAVMAPIIAASQSLFGQSVTTYNEELAASAAAKAAFEADLQAINATGPVISHGGLGYNATPMLTAVSGPHALEFAAENLGRVLVFRGTFSLNEFNNIKLWVTEWVLKKMTGAMKDTWEKEAGLVWTDHMEQDREPWNLTETQKETLRGGSWYSMGSYLNDLADFANNTNNKNLDVDAIREESFWEMTKLIANSVRSSLSHGEMLRITGQSQGGARASLVSMYFKKTYNEAIETITFGATGVSCFPRQLWLTGANHLDDVDPHVKHEQIKDYTHVLDPWGMALDIETGYSCKYGTTNLATSPEKNYCERVFGYAGPEFFLSGFAPTLGIAPELALELPRCTYFTHSWAQTYALIQSDVFITPNGETDGGCKLGKAIPLNDPEGICPSSQVPWMDGCEDKTTCEACMSSTSNSGYGCLWCAESSTCVSETTAWYESCASTWQDSTGSCPNDSGDVNAALAELALRTSTITLLLLSLILVPLWLV